MSHRLSSGNQNTRELTRQGATAFTAIRKVVENQDKATEFCNPGIRRPPQTQLPLENHGTKDWTLEHLKKNTTQNECLLGAAY